jgi:uncharacterized protein YodC (DUF2158 family)|tara:strand:- start:100 stop:309 length:210 start_codon:yes stop_codon:yes gene_type:complete
MNPTFKIGDVVRLKSAELYMTVNGLTEDGNIECKWFNYRWSDTHSEIFKPETLTHKPDGFIITNAKSAT